MREPDAWDAVRVLAIGLIFYLGVLALQQARPPSWVVGAALGAVFLGVPLVYAKAAGLRPLRASGFARLGLRPLVLVLVASLGSMWLLKDLSDRTVCVLTEMGVNAGKQVRDLEEQVGRTTEKGGVVAVLVLVAAPALCEEVFFRGILFRGLARTLGAAWALVLTTALFSSLHGPLVQKVMMVFAGLYFGLVVWLTRSLWAGVVAHAVNNMAVVAVSALFGARVKSMTPPLWMLALSAGVFGMAIALLALDRAGESRLEMQGSGGGRRPE